MSTIQFVVATTIYLLTLIAFAAIAALTNNLVSGLGWPVSLIGTGCAAWLLYTLTNKGK